MAEHEEIPRQLQERFIAAIRASFEPCPLIGPKWFRWRAEGNPPRFEFTGARRLAKALGGMKTEKVNQKILRKARLDELGLDPVIRKNGDVHVPVPREKLDGSA
jgi:hypothetical protein